MTRDEKLILAQFLALEPFWGATSLKNLLLVLQTAKMSLEDFWQNPAKLVAPLLLTPARLQSISVWKKKFSGADFENYLQARRIKVCFLEDNSYPALLRFIPDCPLGFFYQGNLACLQRPTLAVVGTRQITAYGQKVITKLLNHQLRRFTIVSGLMTGVDEAAHRQALALNIPTAAILGYGLNCTWPRYLQDLRREILNHQGLIISEYAPWSTPKAFRFPLRNRLVAGMSLGTLVVEAARKSGSLITANLALDYGREVFTVPGSIFSELSNGTLKLWQAGALPIAQTGELIKALLANQVTSLPANFYQQLAESTATNPDVIKLETNKPKQFAQPLQNKIYQILQTADLDSEEISAKLTERPAEVAMQLSLLELAGEIKQNHAQKWQICVNN